MRCHSLDVQAGWLEEKPQEHYESYITDAFHILNLINHRDSPEQDQHQPELKLGVSQSLPVGEDLEKLIQHLEESEDVQPFKPEAHVDMLKKYIISEDDARKEVALYKKGGIFSSTSKRPGMIELNEVYQLKKPGSKEIAKSLGKITNMVLEIPHKFNKILPWSGSSMEKGRLLIQTTSRPVAIYYTSVALARKTQEYLKLQALIHENETFHQNMEEIINDFRNTFRMKCTIFLEKGLLYQAELDAKEKKKHAKLHEMDLDFIVDTENKIIQRVLECWLQGANRNFKVWEELKKQEEEKVRLEKERAEKEQQEKIKKEEERKQKKKLGTQEYTRQKIRDQTKNQDILAKTHLISGENDNIYSAKNIVPKFTLMWAKRAEFYCNAKNISQHKLNITFRDFLVSDQLQMSRPTLDINFVAKRSEFDLDMMPSKTINNNSYQINLDGAPFFVFRMQGQLKDKSRYEYFCWDLKENVFESFFNVKRQKQQVVDGCSISIANFSHQDLLSFELYDILALTDTAKSEKLDLCLADLIMYTSEPRTLWFLLQYKKEAQVGSNENQELTRDIINSYVIPVEVDIQFQDPGDRNNIIYDDTLTNIVINDQLILDPIYAQNIKPPFLNKNTIKVLLKILEENNAYYVNHVKIIKFIIYIGNKIDPNPDIPSNEETYIEIKKFTIRKILENAFMLLTRLPANRFVWGELKQICSTALQKPPQAAIIPILQDLYNRDGRYPLLDNCLKKLCLNGIDPQIRPAFWFTLLDGMNNYKLLKDILKRRFFIFPEERVEIPEQTWLYSQIKHQTEKLRQNIYKDIDKFIELQKKKKTIPNPRLHDQLKNILQTFVVFGACNSWQINLNYLPYLFQIALRITSIANYHYIQNTKRTPLIDDAETRNQDKRIIQVTHINEKQEENEAIAFWLLLGFARQVLATYPLYNNSKTVLQDDCSYVYLYLNKYQPKIIEVMKTHDLKFENVVYDLLLSVFSEIFASEILYHIWDIIIYYTIKANHANVQNEQKTYIIPVILTMLFERLSNKIQLITSIDELYSAIALEGNLIANNEEFLEQLEDTYDKFKSTVENKVPLDPKSKLQLKSKANQEELEKPISIMKPDDLSVLTEVFMH